ncbi:hypothetical protein RFI_26492, partial [Reticulomyxa filosa]
MADYEREVADAETKSVEEDDSEEKEEKEEEEEEEEEEEIDEIFFEPTGGPFYDGQNVDIAERLLINVRFCNNKGQVLSQENLLTQKDNDYLDSLDNEAIDDLQYVLDVFVENIDLIYSFSINNEQIEFIFDCVLAILPYSSKYQQSVERISQSLTTQDDKFAELNLKLLTNLFNYLPNTITNDNNNLRPLVMQRLLSLVLKSPPHILTKLMKGKLEQLKSWIKEWKVKDVTKKILLESAWQVARRNCDDEMAQYFLIEYLKEWKNTDNVTDDVMNIASQAVIAAIASEKINTRTFMELANLHIVREMKENTKYKSKYGELYELLMIVYQGTVQDFKQFVTNNEMILKSLGLETDSLLSKMRKLTLCGIGNRLTSIAFSELQQQLHIDTLDDLEELIIEL